MTTQARPRDRAASLLGVLLAGAVFTLLFWPLLAYFTQLSTTLLGITLSPLALTVLCVLFSGVTLSILDNR